MDLGDFYDDLEDELDFSDFNFADCTSPCDESENFLLSELVDEDEELGDPIHLTNTRQLKKELTDEDILTKVRNILAYIGKQGMNLPLFLDAVSWGNSSCTADAAVRYARTALMVSDELPGILEHWYTPPRNKNKGKRPTGARRCLRDFASKCVEQIVDREIKVTAQAFFSPPEDLSEELLTTFDFGEMMDHVKTNAPTFWRLVRRAAYHPEQDVRNSKKDPDMVRILK
jgi:hypothetical protein